MITPSEGDINWFRPLPNTTISFFYMNLKMASKLFKKLFASFPEDCLYNEWHHPLSETTKTELQQPADQLKKTRQGDVIWQMWKE